MWVLISKVQIAHLDWSILLKIPMFQSNTFQLIDIERVNFKMMGGKKEREKKMSVKNKEKKKRKEKVLHNVSRIEENLICLFCLFFFGKWRIKYTACGNWRIYGKQIGSIHSFLNSQQLPVCLSTCDHWTWNVFRKNVCYGNSIF